MRHKLDRYLLSLALVLLPASPSVQAGGDVRPPTAQDKLIVDHSWVDIEGRRQAISIELSEREIEEGLINSPDKASLHELWLYSKVFATTRGVAEKNPRDALEKVSEWELLPYALAKPLNSVFVAGGMTKEAIARFEQVLKDIDGGTYYYLDDDGRTVRLDYPAIVEDQQTFIDRLHQALSDLEMDQTIKQKIDSRLRFLQSIEYDDLVGHDFPLMTPIRMMLEGRGDCESKQLLLAAFLKRIAPGNDIYLVELPEKQHIVLAMEVLGSQGDSTVYHEGRYYLVMDATGPAYLPVSASKSIVSELDLLVTPKRWVKM